MSRYIKVEDAIEAAISGCADWDGGYSPTMDDPIKDAFSSAPTVDAVQVVRCRECEHNHIYSDGTGWCGCANHYGIPTHKDFYCADGERSTE